MRFTKKSYWFIYKNIYINKMSNIKQKAYDYNSINFERNGHPRIYLVPLGCHPCDAIQRERSEKRLEELGRRSSSDPANSNNEHGWRKDNRPDISVHCRAWGRNLRNLQSCKARQKVEKNSAGSPRYFILNFKFLLRF